MRATAWLASHEEPETPIVQANVSMKRAIARKTSHAGCNYPIRCDRMVA